MLKKNQSPKNLKSKAPSYVLPGSAAIVPHTNIETGKGKMPANSFLATHTDLSEEREEEMIYLLEKCVSMACADFWELCSPLPGAF